MGNFRSDTASRAVLYGNTGSTNGLFEDVPGSIVPSGQYRPASADRECTGAHRARIECPGSVLLAESAVILPAKGLIATGNSRLRSVGDLKHAERHIGRVNGLSDYR